MPQKQLTLETLSLVDGGAAAVAFNEFLKAAAKDCEDRPVLDKDRTVSINVKMRPKVGSRGDCDSVEVELEVVSKGPAHKTMPYVMDFKQGGALVFHPDDPHDPESNRLFENQE
jgi:hypothetical protein